MPYALCPMPYALCPMPYALCRIVPHFSEKGYILSVGYKIRVTSLPYTEQVWAVFGLDIGLSSVKQ